MEEILNQFISAMRDAGLGPASQSDIKPDDRRHDYQIEGDAKSKRKGFYKLKIEGDFAFGFFGDYRQGDCIPWSTKTPKHYSAEEKRAFAERLRAEKLIQEEEQRKEWDRMAREAQDTLLFAEKAITHPYLTAKGVQPHGALISGQDLLIPMGDASTIWNHQSIKPDGIKLFMAGAKKQGTWFEIPGTDTIVIAEGFATGASINEATGFTVIVAFDAGNMVAVAPAIRLKYSDNKIIIAADNDQWTKNKYGKHINPGLTKAREAAKLINASVVFPEFPHDDQCRYTDFNDLHASQGLEAVAARILAGPGETPDGVHVPTNVGLQPIGGGLPQSEGWEEGLSYTKSGALEAKSVNNLLLMMRFHESLAGIFRYDSFSKHILVHRCPPWENEYTFEVRPLCDEDYVSLEAYLEKNMGLKASKEKCADAIAVTAKKEENTFNPAADYFKSLVWDGVPRLEGWLKKYVSDGEQPDDYLAFVGKKFLCGLAARAMYPGIKFDTMLILEGKQYAGKSFLSAILATINGVEYFLDDFKDIENKDSLMKMQGKLVVEFPEISTMRKTEVNDLKAFLSRRSDVFRPPYGRNTMEAGRQCVFVGTVNPEGPYLRDVTGNRRYWPVSCRPSLKLGELKLIVPLLHAEAAHLVRAGEQLWPNDAEYQMCVLEQNKRVVSDVWTDKIIEIIDRKDRITTNEILAEMFITQERRTPQMQSRVVQTMIALGWEPSRVGPNKLHGFKKPINKIIYEAKDD